MGDRLAIESVLFKRHACCHGTHSTIDGIVKLRDRYAFAEEDVTDVQLRVPPTALDICCISEPVTGLEGKFSMRHAASVAIAGLATGPEAFTDASVSDPRLVALRHRVTVYPDADRTLTAPTRVILSLKNGDRLEAEVDVFEPTPDAGLPSEWAALVVKFMSLASPVVGASAAMSSVERVERLDPDCPIDKLIA